MCASCRISEKCTSLNNMSCTHILSDVLYNYESRVRYVLSSTKQSKERSRTSKEKRRSGHEKSAIFIKLDAECLSLRELFIDKIFFGVLMFLWGSICLLLSESLPWRTHITVTKGLANIVHDVRGYRTHARFGRNG